MDVTLERSVLSLDNGKAYRAFLNFDQLYFELFAFEDRLEFASAYKPEDPCY